MKQGCYRVSYSVLAPFEEQLFEKLTPKRREKAERIAAKKDRILSAGGGFMISYLYRCVTEGTMPLEKEELTGDDVQQMLAQTGTAEYELITGEDGKPSFAKGGMHFNLSHSGEYLLFAYGETAVGCDLERVRDRDLQKLAERFFHKKEAEAFWEAEDKTGLFYTLWTRKEAYGKMTGRGLKESIDTCFLEPGEFTNADWKETVYESGDGIYYIAVCRERNANR